MDEDELKALKKELAIAYDAKTAIEASIDALRDDVEGDLVDAEGYPRADVDLYALSHSRSERLKLQNDLKKLMGDIKLLVEKIFSASGSANKSNSKKSASGVHRRPFAVIDGVDPTGRAKRMGVEEGDELIELNGLVKFEDLLSVANDRDVKMTVLRLNNELRFEWTRTSLGESLGVHLAPL